MKGVFAKTVVTKEYIAIFAHNGETVFFRNFIPIPITRVAKIFKSFEKQGYIYLFYESFEKFIETLGEKDNED